jgi:acyl-CoA synthetase (AMP-forming)/AMP-acid ligase II
MTTSSFPYSGAILQTTYGVRPGDRVGILLKNRPEFIYALFGTSRHLSVGPTSATAALLASSVAAALVVLQVSALRLTTTSSANASGRAKDMARRKRAKHNSAGKWRLVCADEVIGDSRSYILIF